MLSSRPDRGLSPVIGVVLLVVVAVLLSAVSVGLFLTLTEEREPAPETALSFEEETDEPVPTAYVYHETGDAIDGNRVEIRGAADPEGLEDRELAAGQRERITPVDDTIQVVWFDGDGSSYVLREFDVDPGNTAPKPDEGCGWVDSETNGGVDDITIDGTVVGCDVETQKVITVRNDGVVIGKTVSGNNEVDADDATFYGDVTTEDVFNIQTGYVAGSVTSNTADAKIDDAEVDGTVTAAKNVEVLSGSTVTEDAVSDTKQVKVLNSDVDGDVTGSSVKLDGATISGDVYVDPADFDCTSSTINGQSCGSYSPKDPSDF